MGDYFDEPGLREWQRKLPTPWGLLVAIAVAIAIGAFVLTMSHR